jgi:hypothetical protein
MGVTDSDIAAVIGCFIDVANTTGALKGITEQYKDNRSLGLMIEGSAVKTGFILQNGEIAYLKGDDRPTVLVILDRNTFWRVINTESAPMAKSLIYQAVFLEETLKMVPPPGIGGGALHLTNLVTIFEQIHKVIGG